MQCGKVMLDVMVKIFNVIMLMFEYSVIKDVDLVIEVVVENLKVKGIVLVEIE